MKSVRTKAARLLSRHRRMAMAIAAAGVSGVALLATVTTLSSTASATAGAAIPAAAITRITSAALGTARQNGDASPESAAAVATTHARALRIATPGDKVPQAGAQTVYLVVMKGKFTANFPMPPGVSKPTGTYLSITLNPATFQVMDLGLAHRSPALPLSSLGPVSMLKK